MKQFQQACVDCVSSIAAGYLQSYYERLKSEAEAEQAEGLSATLPSDALKPLKTSGKQDTASANVKGRSKAATAKPAAAAPCKPTLVRQRNCSLYL